MSKKKGYGGNRAKAQTLARREAIITFLSEMEIIARKRTKHQRRKACRKYIKKCDVTVFLED